MAEYIRAYEYEKNVNPTLKSIPVDKKNIAECKNKPTMLEHFFHSRDSSTIDDIKVKEISYLDKYLTNINESSLDINNYTIQSDICKF
jgi:hypothetical protein